jgi:hypothetical protein
MRRPLSFVIMLLIGSCVGHAAPLQVSVNCNSTPLATQGAVTGPLTVPFTCPTGPGIRETASGTVIANYPTLGSGSAITFAGDGTVSPVADFLDAGRTGNGISIQSSTLPVGTPVALTVTGSLNGTYSYSNAGNLFIADTIISEIAIPGVVIPGVYGGYLLFNEQSLYFCNPQFVHTKDSCDAGEGVISGSGSGSGSLSIPLVSGTLKTTIGASGINLDGSFAQEIGGGGTFITDFLDGFVITNVEVTDPNTGQLLSGVTITGASGISYPVNASSIPEPSTLGLVAGLLLAFSICRRTPHRVRRM